MPSTTHPDFDSSTEAREVAKAFADLIRGKTILVTGVNHNGLGYATADAFASQSPAHLIVTGRNSFNLKNSIDALRAEFPGVNYLPLHVDLSSQESVRAAASEVLAWDNVPAIDIVVNNAGVMLLPERTLNADGIEMHMATNHIGHFLLTNLIMPKLIKAAETSPKGATRVINVSSGSPGLCRMRWSDLVFEKITAELPEAERPNPALHKAWGTEDVTDMAYIPLEGYNQSKVANVLFGIGVTRQLYAKHGILGLSLHPGVIQTELARNATPGVKGAINTMLGKGLFTYKTLGAGAATSLVAALDPKMGEGPGQTKAGKDNYGCFLADCQISDMANRMAVSSAEADKLWLVSEGLVKQEFTY